MLEKGSGKARGKPLHDRPGTAQNGLEKGGPENPPARQNHAGRENREKQLSLVGKKKKANRTKEIKFRGKENASKGRIESQNISVSKI